MFSMINHQWHTDWTVPTRYEGLNPIGHGAYGSVCSAYDRTLQRQVAIKKLARPFHSPEYAKRTYRELRIIHHMDHENVTSLIDVFTDNDCREAFQNVYFTTPLLLTNLSTFISNDVLTEDHIKFFIYQILRGLKYIHSSNVIHRDLKPANIVVNEDSELKIIDFGLARQNDNRMTEYTTTRWYRAPEIIIFSGEYSSKADIWSVGCIMAEMFTRKPLLEGGNPIDQLKKIMELVGPADYEFMNKFANEETRNFFCEKFQTSVRKDFSLLFQQFTRDDNAIDLLEKMLVLDPDRRISATEALDHPYLDDYHDENDEPTAPPYIDPMEGKSDVDLEKWKDEVWKFIQEFNPRISSLMQSN